MKNLPIIIYKTEDGNVKIETHFNNESVWLTIEQIAELFQKPRSTKPTHFYNLDVVISVGYRVKSHRGVHFRNVGKAID